MELGESNRGDGTGGKGGISFSFAKKKEVRQLEVSSVGEVDKVRLKSEKDFILSVEENKVTSVIPKEEPKELVIPLIERNEWQNLPSSNHQELDQGTRSADSTEKKHEITVKREKKDKDSPMGAGDALESEAVKEIMKDVSRYNEEWHGRNNDDQDMTIPLLMQNKVPEGYETENKLDVSIRPHEASEANYEEVPIEQFGMAMLRGMGWKEGEGIGSKMKRVVAPIEITVRPKGQGLGADRRPGDVLDGKRKPKRKPGDPVQEVATEDPTGFSKDAAVLVTSGPHKNLYGQIEGVDEDNSRVVIKFALNGQVTTLSQFAVQLVTKEEYKKYAKDLGRFSKGHEELKKRTEQSKDGNDSQRRKQKDTDERTSKTDKHSKRSKSDRDSSNKHSSKDIHKDDKDIGCRVEKHRHGHRHSGEDRYKERSGKGEERDRHGNKRQCGRRCDDADDGAKKRRTNHDRTRNFKNPDSKETMYWLHPDLRVRFIDALYRKGKYYNVKVRVVDVITRDVCTCQTDEGRYLEDIHQSMLETLIPKHNPAYIKVVSGKLKGQLGTVLSRDKVNCRAEVQLLRDRERIVTMDYDTICEYAGNIQDEEDY